LRRSAAEERLRIAREVHDVLGHHVSLINVQAGAALHGLAKRPEQAETALVAIKDSSGEALRELRRTLGVLRQVDEEAPTSPSPGLARIDELVDRAREAGLAVTLDIEGTPRPVDAEVGLAAFRIVQESLTNVTRHAHATDAVVLVRYGEETVDVQVDDNGRGSPSGAVEDGSGLLGMAQRADALGGEFAAAPRAGGGFRVSARLPLGEPA
ncbi:MAG: sensor histidine kinase, partial [Pseudonocardia sp.]|nr:sensor histidine kinase [Pseudonocardia sp.]